MPWQRAREPLRYVRVRSPAYRTFATITLTGTAVVAFPAASLATAVTVWAPLAAVAVSHVSS